MDEQTQMPMPVQQELEIEREDDFESLYANNVAFGMSLYDLKMIFGQIDQREGKTIIGQHTAITIPWIQAKLMIYFLQVNVAVFEAESGKIKIPDRLLPPYPQPLPEVSESDPQVNLIREIREKFIADLK